MVASGGEETPPATLNGVGAFEATGGYEDLGLSSLAFAARGTDDEVASDLVVCVDVCGGGAGFTGALVDAFFCSSALIAGSVGFAPNKGLANDTDVGVVDDPKAEKGDADDEGVLDDGAKALNGDADEVGGAFAAPKAGDDN